MAEKEVKKDVKEKVEVITAIYKVNLHCHQCGRDIRKPLMRTQGIQSVEVDMEKGEIKVKCSNLDVLKIHKRIEKLSKKKVELISPKVKPIEKENTKATDKKATEAKALISRTITAKVHLHCSKCEQDLKKKLLAHQGIYSVKTDMKTQTLTVEGTLEADKFKSYLKKKLQKHIEITSEKIIEESKPAEKKKLEESKPAEKKQLEESKPTDQKKIEESKPAEKKKDEKKETEKEKEKTSSETTKTVEIREEVKIVEVKTKDSKAPYFIHYVYAPQLFSDENPNACHIM